ncbi:MAG: histidine kinase [Bacteroidetes bacterium]|nr:histidine kinase [Bacteroidota bacterium]
MKVRFIYVLFALLIIYCANAQKNLIKFNNLTIENGLGQGTINGIVHSKDGFIWIATADGLHRYDGYNFKIYRNEPNIKNSLPDNYITCIFEDGKSNLLIGLYNGEVCILNKQYSTFRKIDFFKTQNSKELVKPITCIAEDEKGSYLIGVEETGLIKYDTTTKKYSIINSSNSTLKSNNIKCIYKDIYTGKFLICTSNGLAEYNTGTSTVKFLNNLNNISEQAFTTVLTPEPHKILIGTYGKGLYQYIRGEDSACKVILPKSKGTRFITFLLKNSNDNSIWVGTLGGVIKLKDGEKILYTNNPQNPESLVDNNTQTGIIDKFGSLWIGTINGLSRFDKRLKKFNLFRDFKWKDTLLNNNVYNIYEDTDSSIWLGTLSSGIINFNPKNEKITAYTLVKDGIIETKMVRTILKDRKGQYWIGTRDAGLFKFYPKTGKFKHVKGEKGFEISNNTIRCIFEDSEANFWIGTANGLNLYNRKTNKFKVYRAFEEIPNNNTVYQIEESKDFKKLYIACFRGGLQIFDKKTESFKLVELRNSSTQKPDKNYAMSILKTDDDSLILGTYGSGIFIVNTKNFKYRNISEKNGLSNNSVYGILKYNETIWLSTNRGISSFNKKTGEIKNYGLKNYIQSYEFNEGAFCKARTGLFYFGGVNGFNYFNPANLSDKVVNSITKITSIKKIGVELPVLSTKNGEPYIELNYNDNLISFEFATLNFISTNTNLYAYKLDGYDDNWINAGNRTTAYYTKLTPGNYFFKVKSLSEPQGSSNIAKIKIIIEPPFWQTWWFYSLVVISLVISIYFIIKWRTGIIDQSYKSKLAEMELKALRSQMNPHFIFNSLNSIQYYILKKEPKEAYNYLTKFSSLMRMILQNSNYKLISLKAESEWLKIYLELENLRMDNTLEWNIKTDEKIETEKTFLPAMVLQPYVENAIIHGLLPKSGNRNLAIEIMQESKILKFIITDNGIGRKKSFELNKARLKHHESTAMNLTKDRLTILNIETTKGMGPKVIDLYDENNEPSGTRVEICLPLITKNNEEKK